MITLHQNGPNHEFKAGEVVHLKVTRIYEQAPGKWRLECDDVTPLPGAEPVGYACRICGLVEEAKRDGSLPKGWTQKKYEKGVANFCSDCRDEPMCRVCGCSNNEACGTETGPCHWVEPDLCSACKK